MSSQSYRNAALVATLMLSSSGISSAAQAQTQSPRNPAIAGAPKNPDTAPQVSIDRFSAKAGKLQVRTATNGLPGPNQPVDFDRSPFMTRGFGPDGAPVNYYDFDVHSTTPAPIYGLFREGETQPVAGQLNIVDVIPGENGYNDFWQVVKVTVPRDYVANTVTSVADIRKAGYRMDVTPMLVNCPIVPRGSVARMRLNGGSAELQRGWYRGRVINYFSFKEHGLQVSPSGEVPRSLIYVAFRTNPDQPGGGPASGFDTEPGSKQTHNIIQTVPSDAGYSPLWLVNVYDNANFPRVRDLPSVLRAKVVAPGVALVNCPVVWVGKSG
jgi:hypothetical protein